MNLRAAIVLSLVISSPLSAQVRENLPPSTSEAQSTAPSPPAGKEAEPAVPAPKLRAIAEGQTLNFIPKFDGSGPTGLTESILFENNGKVGIGTTDPKVLFHLFGAATSDVAFGVGPDPSFGGGPALNVGYGGSTYGRGAGFFNVRPDASAAAPNPSLRFSTGDVQRMIITNTGAVGIGNSAPPGKLTVVSTSLINPPNGYAIHATQRTTVTGTQNDTAIHADVIEDIPSAGVTNTGGIIGIRSSAWKNGPGTLTWATGGYFMTGNPPGTPGTITNAYGIQAHVLAGTGTVTKGHGVYVGDVEATSDWAFYQVSASDTNYFAGNVVIGGPPTTANTYALAVEGDANFNGVVTGTNIKARYQDVAEWVPSTSDLAPGTVVILNRGRNNEVMASATAYDTTVAGVVSLQPGLSLGIEGEGKEQIATTGRVKVRVDARVKPIAVGDLLVTSDTPGTAMRSEPMSINGRPFHQPGTILGKALEPLEGGVGEILVLLSMQ